MSHALLIGGQILSEGPLPTGARRLDAGTWVTPPGGVWSDDLAAACGYLPVVDVARPADTAGTTWDRTLVLVNGAPTVVWVERDKTTQEVAAEAEATRETALRDAIDSGIDAAVARRQAIDSGADALAGEIAALGSVSLAAVKALGSRVVTLARATADGQEDTIRLARLTVRALDSLDA